MGDQQRISPDELPDKKFLVTAVLPDGTEKSVNLFDHLDLVGVKSLSEVKYVESSTNFPPIPYRNTGRGQSPYGPDYAGIGSGSVVLGLHSGQSVALSTVFTLDRSRHGGSSEHVNTAVVSWPVGKFRPDYRREIGEMHFLPANVDIELHIGDGSKIQKDDKIRPQYEWPL